MFALFCVLLQLSVLAYAIVGGVFLAFSDFIMRSLGKTGGTAGVETMQIINREVFRWVFMSLFLGMVAVSVLVAICSATYLGGGPGRLISLGALVYLIGCFGVTVLFNVPKNEALAGMDLSSEATLSYWTDTYLPRWTMWNTVRTVACSLAAAMVLFGLVWLLQSQAERF